MGEVATIGLDLAKNAFQVHGTDEAGLAVIRKQLRGGQLLEFFARQARCVGAMEACSGSRFRGREIAKLGHEARLIPPAHVKPFLKRQKTDMADAEAICEAAQRPTLRFVAVKGEETQGAAAVFRLRELLVRQRTQAINALRGHLAEFGEVVPQGALNARRPIALVAAPDRALPETMRAALAVLVAVLGQIEEGIADLDAEITRRAREDETARRLRTIPGIGPLIATALATLAPPPGTFRRGRDFAACLGLTPRQHSTGSKQRLGATTKMGERSLRRLPIIGAGSVVQWRARKGAVAGTRRARMPARKPPMLVRVALAGKMARIVRALMAKGEVCRAPVAAA